MVNSTNCFYVYQHVDPRTHLVRYIGKGKGKRAWDFKDRHGHHKNWIHKLASEGLTPEVTLLEVEKTEEQAFELEKLWIAACRSSFQPLTNATDGGEGNSGWVPSEEWRRKRSVAYLGQNNPNFGKKHSEKTRRKISEANIGKTLTDEHRQTLSRVNTAQNNFNFGKPAPTRRALVGTNLQTGEECKFDSVTAAAKFIIGDRRGIQACCRGEQKKTKGWTFKYLNTEGVKNAS